MQIAYCYVVNAIRHASNLFVSCEWRSGMNLFYVITKFISTVMYSVELCILHALSFKSNVDIAALLF